MHGLYAIYMIIDVALFSGKVKSFFCCCVSRKAKYYMKFDYHHEVFCNIKVYNRVDYQGRYFLRDNRIFAINKPKRNIFYCKKISSKIL